MQSNTSTTTTYYISQSTGNDAWPGTEAQPWKTLWRASQQTYQPGDQILLKRGDTWSDEADPEKCELVLKGNADIRSQDWITVGAYGVGDRPHITRPTKDTTPGLLDWSDVVNWAQEHPGTGYDQYADRTYIRIAIRILGNGWKIKDLEISYAEMGINNTVVTDDSYWIPDGTRAMMGVNNAAPSPGDGYWIEDIYFHDMCGLIWPMHPEYRKDSTCFYPSPLTFGAIDMNASNITVKDCAFVRNYDPVFLGGDSIHGVFHNALFENLFITHMIGGGMGYISGNDITVKNCTVLHGEHGHCTLDPDTMEHILTPDFQGCWFGPDSFDICASTNYVMDNVEIAYVRAQMDMKLIQGADQGAMSVQGENVNTTVKNCFFHECMHGTVGIHYGIGIFKQLGTRFENNVIHRNSLAKIKGSVAVAGDAMWPAHYKPGTTSDITFVNNRIYQDVAGGQRLYAYIDGDPDHVWDHFTDPKCAYLPPTGAYAFPEAPEPDGNTIVTTGYDNYAPPPPAIAATNIADPNYPGFCYSFSSETPGHVAANLFDGKPANSWVPVAPYDRQHLTLGWASPQAVDRIRLYDRVELGHCARSLRIQFSDGSEYNVQGGMSDNGAVREIIFDTPKQITEMTFHFTRWEGIPGLSGIQVYTNSYTAPTVLEPEAGEFTCDFESLPVGALLGSIDQNSINWSKADWAVMEEADGNKCAYLNFQPMVGAEPPHKITPLEYANRIFYLPKGKKLKSIDIYTPAGPFNAPEEYAKTWQTGFRVTVSQLGADNKIRITDSDGQWHRNLQLNWTDGPPLSNVVVVNIYALGSPSGYGVNNVAFDNIVYGD